MICGVAGNTRKNVWMRLELHPRRLTEVPYLIGKYVLDL